MDGSSHLVLRSAGWHPRARRRSPLRVIIGLPVLGPRGSVLRTRSGRSRVPPRGCGWLPCRHARLSKARQHGCPAGRPRPWLSLAEQRRSSRPHASAPLAEARCPARVLRKGPVEGFSRRSRRRHPLLAADAVAGQSPG